MKKIIVKYIGVKSYTVDDETTTEEINNIFHNDLANVPESFAKNIVPIAYAEEE